MKVFVIVVTYNGAEEVSGFLQSFKQFSDLEEVELVVVDNNSSDETISIIEREASFAHVIRNATNTGFTGGNNVGMHYALSEGAEYVMLVNQDIRFGAGWLEPLKAFLQNNPDVGAVQPKIMLHPQTRVINSCGNAFHYLGFGYTMGYQKKDEDYSCHQPRDVAYCSFSAVLLSARALQVCGLFDDRLFMYHEDSDFCWRMRLKGFRCVVVPSVTLFHHYEFSRSIQKFYYIERNRLLIMVKNYRIKTLFLILPMLFVWELSLLLMSMVGFLFMKKTIGLPEKLLGYAYFFSPRHWVDIIRTRSDVQRSRLVSDRDIVSLFSDIIDFQDVSNPLLTYVANPMTRAYWRLVKRFI